MRIRDLDIEIASCPWPGWFDRASGCGWMRISRTRCNRINLPTHYQNVITKCDVYFQPLSHEGHSKNICGFDTIDTTMIQNRYNIIHTSLERGISAAYDNFIKFLLPKNVTNYDLRYVSVFQSMRLLHYRIIGIIHVESMAIRMIKHHNE